MIQPSPYHEVEVAALPDLLCTDDPMVSPRIWAAASQRLNDLGVHKIDLALPSYPALPSLQIDIEALSDLLCTDDPVLMCRIWAAVFQRLNDLGVHKIDVALPPSRTGLAPPSSQADTQPSLQTKPRKRHPATDIKRIEAATGKVVKAVTLGDDGRVTGYTFDGAPATENPFDVEATRLRALKRGSA